VALFKSNRRLGTTLLAVWLIAQGVLALVPIAIPFIGQILAILAIAAGVLILLER
jgi:hypothetical protein